MMVSYFSIHVITWEGNYPEDVAISDDEGAIGNHHHPLVISRHEFLRLFRKMATVVERLALHDAMKIEGDASMKQRRSPIDFNSFKDDLNDSIILYLKMSRLEEGYGNRFNDSKKKDFSQKKREMLNTWYGEMHALYRKLMIDQDDDRVKEMK